jgi:isoleucyl-tRNA synthetase
MPDNPIQTAGEELSKLLSQLQKIMEMMEAQQKAIKAELKASLKEGVDNARFKALTEHQTKITDQLAEANKLAQEQNKHIEALIKNQNNAQGQTQNGPANAVTAVGAGNPAQDPENPTNGPKLSNEKSLAQIDDPSIEADSPAFETRPRGRTVADDIGKDLQTPLKVNDDKTVSIDTDVLRSSQGIGVTNAV